MTNEAEEQTMTDIATVTVLGAGVLGAQIAYQAAFSGFDVVAYDVNETALAAARKRFVKLAATYEEQVKNRGPFVAGSVPNPRHGRLEHGLQHRAAGNEEQRRLARFLKENYIDKGKLGVDSAEGFYRYPYP